MQVRNSITLIGNLGSNPETRTLPSGRLVTEFSLATNDYYRDKNGDRQTRTDWHRIKAYGKLAEIFDKHLAKGSQVCVAGALRYSKWIDKHDQVRTSAEVVADSFTFLSPGKSAEAEADMAAMVTEPASDDHPRGKGTNEPTGKSAPKASAKAKTRKTARRKAVGKTSAKTVQLDPSGADLPF